MAATVLDTHALQLPGLPFFYHDSRSPQLGALQVTTHQQSDHNLRHGLPFSGINFLRHAITRASETLTSGGLTHVHADTCIIETTTLYKACHTTIPKNLFDLAVCLMASQYQLHRQDDDRTTHVSILFDSSADFWISCTVLALRKALDIALDLRFDHDLDSVVSSLPSWDSGERLRYLTPSTNPYGEELHLAAVLQEGLGLNSHFILCKRQAPAGGLTFLSQFAVQAKVNRSPEHVLFSHAFSNRTTALRRELGSIDPWRSTHPWVSRGGDSLGGYGATSQDVAYWLKKLSISRRSHP